MLWPVALGVAVATAVIVGALLVGDSVRGSLHFLATDRLGKIDSLLLAPRFFQQRTIESWPQAPGFPASADPHPVPAIVFPKASVVRRLPEAAGGPSRSFSGNAMVLGITAAFWSLGKDFEERELGLDEVILNQALADELQARTGDSITIRLPAQAAVPADSPLGKRETETFSLPALKVVSILPNRSVARFDLRSNQRPAKNAFVSLKAIQQALDREGQVNAAFLRSTGEGLLPSMPVTLEDLGLRLEEVQRVFPDLARGEKADAPPTTIFDYYQLTTDQMLLPPVIVDEIHRGWPFPQAADVLTYLANGIEVVGRGSSAVSVPYSTISAVEPRMLSTPSIGFAGPHFPAVEAWADDEVYINRWLARELAAEVGESLRIDYYLPETVDGLEVEKSVTLKVAGVVPLAEPAIGYRRQRPPRFEVVPTPFNDSALTPEVPGITDQASISDWDLPFALTREIRKADDDYWTNHRLTPKLFLTLKQGQKLFGSRFGEVSSIRFAKEPATTADGLRAAVLRAILPKLDELGWQLLPIREQQLAAAKGTTPFDMLFLSLSLFVILAALILVMLLFRLGIERRASQWGLLLSLGWPMARVRKLLSLEGWLLSVAGGGLGILLGIAYAYGVLALLRSWWVGAVGAPFLQFFMTWPSLLIGVAIGIVVAWLTIGWAIRALARQPVVQLLRGRVASSQVRHGLAAGWWRWFHLALLGLIAIVCGSGFYLRGQAAGGAFVGAGMLALGWLLSMAWQRLTRPRFDGASLSRSTDSLAALAKTSIYRQPLRSVLTMGLMAVATLLILSMSLFEATPDVQGTGGFQGVADANVPIAKNLSDGGYLKEVLGERAATLGGATILPFRVKDGDDAGCNNLYQASQPRVLGVSPRMAAYEEQRPSDERFAWANSARDPEGRALVSSWRALEKEADGSRDAPIPAIIDQNTAMWALHLTGGVGQVFTYTFGTRQVYFQTVALLQNTILQGCLLVGEANFQRIFPEVSGYRSWLIHTPASAQLDGVAEVLEDGWSDEGLDVVHSDEVLRNLLAVQNTYLKAFQSLGALGLLLGTLGLAVVQLRSVMERQAEFGLLQAIGFTPQRIGWLVMLESLTLLAAGLGIGGLAAAVALLPAWGRGAIQPTYWIPLAMVAVIAACGTLASFVAVRQAMRCRILQAIRQG
jgi:putative ABC transport system permease protein